MEWIQTIQRERIGTIGQNSQDTRGGKSIDERKDWSQKNEDVLEAKWKRTSRWQEQTAVRKVEQRSI